MRNREMAALLVREGLLSGERAHEAVEEAELSGYRVDTLCLVRNWVVEEALLKAVGRAFNSRTADRSVLANIPPRVLGLVPARVAERFRVVPFRLEAKTLSVAGLDPADLLVEDELRLLTGCAIRSHAALEVRLHQALAEAYGVPLPPVMKNWLERARPVYRLDLDPSTRPVARPKATGRRPVDERFSRKQSAGEKPEEPAAPEELELSSEELGQFPGLADLAVGAGVPAGGAPGSGISRGERGPAASMPPSRQTPADDHGLDPEERLAAASIALGKAEMRDDIADVLLSFCRPYFQRRALFILRRDTIVGWRGEGEGVDETILRAVQVPVVAPSVFQALLHGTAFWLGPLASMPHNLDLALGLGGEPTGGCTVFPIRLKGRVVCFLWGDNLDAGLGSVPLPQLRRLVAKAGLAFETYILRAKIRSM